MSGPSLVYDGPIIFNSTWKTKILEKDECYKSPIFYYCRSFYFTMLAWLSIIIRLSLIKADVCTRRAQRIVSVIPSTIASVFRRSTEERWVRLRLLQLWNPKRWWAQLRVRLYIYRLVMKTLNRTEEHYSDLYS